MQGLMKVYLKSVGGLMRRQEHGELTQMTNLMDAGEMDKLIKGYMQGLRAELMEGLGVKKEEEDVGNKIVAYCGRNIKEGIEMEREELYIYGETEE